MQYNVWLILLCSSFSGWTQTATDKEVTPVAILCQFESIEITHEAMNRMLFLNNQSLTAGNELHHKLRDMVAKNQAKVVDTQLILVNNGQKATVESITQTAFPTDHYGSAIHELYQKNKALHPELMRAMELIRTPHIPRSFEFRDIGAILEVAPLWNPNEKKISLNYSWEQSEYEGEKSWIEFIDNVGSTQAISTPLFFTKRLSSTVTCAPAEYTWIGMMDAQNPQTKNESNKKCLVFVKCDIQKHP